MNESNGGKLFMGFPSFLPPFPSLLSLTYCSCQLNLQLPLCHHRRRRLGFLIHHYYFKHWQIVICVMVVNLKALSLWTHTDGRTDGRSPPILNPRRSKKRITYGKHRENKKRTRPSAAFFDRFSQDLATAPHPIRISNAIHRPPATAYYVPCM